MLTKATYSDDTPSVSTDNPVANYTYQGSNLNASVGALLLQATDVRYSGPLRRIKYVYATNSGAVFGQISAEKTTIDADPTHDVIVSSYNLPTHTETRGDSTSANPATRQFTYSSYRMITEKDFNGNVTTYGYDSAGYRASVKNALDQTTTMTREAKTGNITRITYPGGDFKAFTYTDANYPYWVQTTTDELGRVTTYGRDGNHRVTVIYYPATTQGTAYETFAYNAFGQVTEHRMTNAQIESNSYNSLGQLTSHTDPFSKTTTYTYDGNGRLKTTTDPLQNVTTYFHNERGLMTGVNNPDGSAKTMTYDVFGNLLTEANAKGETVTYGYDLFKRLISTKDPANKVTVVSYLKNQGTSYNHNTSNAALVTSPEGRKVATTYDSNFAPLTVTKGASTSDASTTTYTYSTIGQQLTLKNALNKTWTNTYDNRGRRSTSKDPLNHTTTWTYDAVGNVKTVKLADNTITTNTYDSRNRVTSILDASNTTIGMEYSRAGNLTTLTDKRGKTYTYAYDALNRQTRQTYPDTSYEETGYDEIGRMKTYRNRAGNVQTSTYNVAARTMQTAWDASGDSVITYLDNAGRPTDVGSNAGSLHYLYDTLGRVTREEQIVYGLPSKSVNYTYDADGNRLSTTYPDGTSLTYTWNNRSENTGIYQNGTCVAYYVPDALGRPSSKDVYPGAQTNYHYDDAGNVDLITHHAGATVIGSFNYGYNRVDNRTYVKREDGLGDVFGYDFLQQLKTVQYDASSVDSTPANPVAVGTYNYDNAGNRLDSNMTGTTPRTYVADPNNTYGSISGVSPATNPVYDNNRNLAAWKGWSYTHDADSKLSDAVSPTTNAHFYRDGSSRISKSVINGVTVYNIYDGWDIILRYDASGAVLDRMVYGTGSDEIISRTTASGNASYYLFDGQGSVSHVVGLGNVLLERYSYDAYGSVTIEAPSGAVLPGSAIGNRYLFTGREYLAEIGLYDYRNRTYSAEQGRFLEPDPTGFGAGDDNLYRYCGNNPVNGRDPSGLKDEVQVKPENIQGITYGRNFQPDGSFELDHMEIVNDSFRDWRPSNYGYNAADSGSGLRDGLGNQGGGGALEFVHGQSENPGYATAALSAKSQYEVLNTVPSGKLLINFLVQNIKAGHIKLFFLDTDVSPSITYPDSKEHVTIFMRPHAPATVIAHEIQHSVRMLTGNSDYLLPVSDSSDDMQYMLENQAVRAQNIVGIQLGMKNGSTYRPLLQYSRQPPLQNPYGRYLFGGK